MTKSTTNPPQRRLHVTCGPTISASEVHTICPDAIVHPPVRHGDLYRMQLHPGDRVLIVDGLFHQSAPIRHKEILDTIAAGVDVLGSSSMGALRAAELHRHGMRGIGRIFDLFAHGVIDNDDAVAVVHLEEEDQYRALSEPLVNFRFALHDAAAAAVIDSRVASAILDQLQQLDYPSRTWKNLQRIFKRDNNIHLADQCAAVTSWLTEHPASANTKKADALHALDELAREAPQQSNAPAERWATGFVYQWRNRFRPYTSQPAEPLTSLAALQYTQLYDPQFPELWRTVMLAHISAITALAPEKHLLRAADFEIANHAITVSDLATEQRDQWLTPDEQRTLDDRTQVRLIVMRSTPLTPLHIDSSTPWSRPIDARVRHNAGDARAAVTTTASLLPAGFTVDQLSDGHLVNSLDAEWGLSAPTPLQQEIAARQRGFLSYERAKDASRTFVLARTCLPK
ncbi:TfuA-like protein [Nocardia sp. R7R-8]|uniref:TfuA-like protein n=1 Tax=Nocardia sp. R7R-8 TaxID=3459304 RepID=UPI00403DC9BC